MPDVFAVDPTLLDATEMVADIGEDAPAIEVARWLLEQGVQVDPRDLIEWPHVLLVDVGGVAATR